MGRRVPFAIGEYYHLYNRGVDRRQIFKDKFEYLRFVVLLHLCNSSQDVDVHTELRRKSGPHFFEMLAVEQDERLVAVGAYCLMPNHFHVLAKEVTEDGISRFMRKLLTAYSMFFNSRHDRSGTLFEGRYKAKHVDSDEYLRYLYAYIHLNPVKLLDSEWKEKDDIDTLRIKDYLEKYDYSSYQTYLGKDTLQQHVLSKTEFPEYFTKAADFSTLIHDWLTLKEQYRK